MVQRVYQEGLIDKSSNAASAVLGAAAPGFAKRHKAVAGPTPRCQGGVPGVSVRSQPVRLQRVRVAGRTSGGMTTLRNTAMRPANGGRILAGYRSSPAGYRPSPPPLPSCPPGFT